MGMKRSKRYSKGKQSNVSSVTWPQQTHASHFEHPVDVDAAMGGVSRIFMQHHPATFREFPKAVMPRALTLPERRADEIIGTIDDFCVCSAAKPICISGSSNYAFVLDVC